MFGRNGQAHSLQCVVGDCFSDFGGLSLQSLRASSPFLKKGSLGAVFFIAVNINCRPVFNRVRIATPSATARNDRDGVRPTL